MPTKIDQTLIPPVIRDSVDPEILNRAQSIEWTIDRSSGQEEHGFLDGSHEDYLSGQNLLPKTHGRMHYGDGVKQLCASGRDSGIEFTPTSPMPGGGRRFNNNNLSALDELDDTLLEPNKSNVAGGQMKSHPKGVYPFPIYKVNQEQLKGDVFFEVAPRAAPGERTVHHEKSTRILNEEEVRALNLDEAALFGDSATLGEQEEETIETTVLKGGAQELEQLYNSMRTGAGDYFDNRQRARSLSPSGRGGAPPIETQSSEQHMKTVVFGSMNELDNREQEYYPYRDAHQGKPLPGENEYGTWGSRFDEQKQWKLCNGQWVRVAPPKPEPKQEKVFAEKIKCKPPKRGVARSEPVRQVQPQGSTDSDTDSDSANELDLEPRLDVEPIRRRIVPPIESDDDDGLEPFIAKQVPRFIDDEKPVDIDALKDKYRPKVAEKVPQEERAPPRRFDNNNTKTSPEPTTGTILLEPIRPPTPPLEEIKVEPIQPTYVEMKKPLKQPDGEEEKMMEDPNLMWMHMGPAQYGPPFGTMKRRKAREEEWVGPPCELCHKQIEERRCMLAHNLKFHCWHFGCSFCLKTLKPADFLIAEADNKPYCLNCHKREFPEISLVNLHLEE